MHAGRLFCICLLVINTSSQVQPRGYSDSDNFFPNVDSSEEQIPSPEMVRPKTGKELILKCKTQDCNRIKRKSSIAWEFAACKPCRKKEEITWTKVETKAKCKLDIYNVSRNQNGLYRCSINDVTTTLYEVDVMELINFKEEPPKVLEVIISPNSTVQQYNNVLIQCKVHSAYRPEITWFKQSETHSKYDIEYKEKFYTRINAPYNVYQMPNEDHIFLSKVSLQNVTHWNSGVYVCVTLNAEGKDLQRFTITVIPDNDLYNYPFSLTLLFLIPLPFALIPIIVWLCYFKNKKAKDRVPHEQVLISANEL